MKVSHNGHVGFVVVRCAQLNTFDHFIYALILLLFIHKTIAALFIRETDVSCNLMKLAVHWDDDVLCFVAEENGFKL